MALIKCSECGREVSDKAPNCPGCGAPILPAKGAQIIQAPHEVQARSGVADGVKIGCGMFIVLPILILLAIVIFAVMLGGLGSGRSSSTPSGTPSAYVPPTPEEMAARDALTAAHNKGWNWAKDNDVSSADKCSTLSSPDEQVGCVSYATTRKP